MEDLGRPGSGRRRLLGLGAAGLGALAATTVGGTRAAAHGTLHESSSTDDPAIHGDNAGSGPGVLGTGASGVGVRGRSSGLGSPGVAGHHAGPQIGPGVFGESENGAGVFGRGGPGPGVVGHVTSGGAPGVAGNNEGNGPGVYGEAHGAGLAGVAGYHKGESDGPGTYGESSFGPGVVGVAHATDRAGVAGQHIGPGTGPGIFGSSGSGPGVLGQASGAGVAGVAGHHAGTAAGAGVHGSSNNGPGVRGIGAIGVEAISEETALRVTAGRSRFNTVGAGAIAAGDDQVFLPNPLVSPRSHVTVTLVSDPQRDTAVSWIERVPGMGFRVHLSRPARGTTQLTYFIVEPLL